MADISPEESAEMFPVAQKINSALRAVNRDGSGKLRCAGVNVLLADGATAGQEVFHTHLHVIPRFENDGFKLRFQPDKCNRDELDDLAKTISDKISDATKSDPL